MVRKPVLAAITAVIALGVSASVAAAAAPPSPASPPNCGNGTIVGGTTLQPGSVYYSNNCEYYLTMQTDGNLVWYSGTALWNTETSGQSGNYAKMQTDGNFVLYSSGGQERWQSGTYDYSGAFLRLQNDGNLVVYSSSGTALWAYSWIHSAGGAQAYSQNLFVQYGWSVSGQYSYLYDLWTRESGWEWNARNPSSGAYGIPQALPASKLGDTSQRGGSDWSIDGLTQVQWGLQYISGRYGTPYAAWEHELQYGWYGPAQ